MPDADIEDYLLSVAEKNPDKIISLYTGNDTSLRILFMDAKDKKVILSKNKINNNIVMDIIPFNIDDIDDSKNNEIK